MIAAEVNLGQTTMLAGIGKRRNQSGGKVATDRRLPVLQRDDAELSISTLTCE